MRATLFVAFLILILAVVQALSIPLPSPTQFHFERRQNDLAIVKSMETAPATTTAMPEPTANQKEPGMWLPFNVASSISDWANIIFVGSLVVGFIAVLAIWQTAGIKEAYWDKYRKDADERIAAAVKEAAEANKAAAVASEKAAVLDKETAGLKLALAQEVAARQPRTISPEQKAQIVALLRNDSAPKGRIVVLWKLFDEEAEAFAKQVIDVLNASGFTAVQGNGPMSFNARGAWIVVRDLNAAKATPNALGTVQATFKAVLNIDLSGSPWVTGFPDEDAIIAIGPKPF